MLSKNKLKFLRALGKKKNRDTHHQILVEGEKLIRDLLLHHREYFIEIYGTKEHCGLPGSTSVPYFTLSPSVVRQISQFKTPPDYLALCHIPVLQRPDISPPLLLYLDDIRDPGNMGTIIRTANWFGHSQILRSPTSVDPFNPKVVQASMGAVFDIFIERIDWYEMVRRYDSYRLMAADMKGTPLEKIHPSGKDIIIIGNEGQGIDKNLLLEAQQVISIPGAPGQRSESLNAAISAAILCYQWAVWNA